MTAVRPTTIADLDCFLASTAALRESRGVPAPEAEATLDPDDYARARLGPCNIRLRFGVVADRILLRERGSPRWLAAGLESGWVADGRPVLATSPDPGPHSFARATWPPIASHDCPAPRGVFAS